MEQVQPNSLRHGQSSAEDSAGLQVQHLLSRPHRQEFHAGVLAGMYIKESLFKYESMLNILFYHLENNNLIQSSRQWNIYQTERNRLRLQT